ncbi:HET-domain-containing protein [Mytilinidion resinicola]|uniref:HET-domain-containing protein n=1 Tax=Mytilinidion resinicola TaxID=574789 RepID=A0A6A6Y3F7_9PEZI|nr:HET-domain-containing protein [Mytilinidion resinicola]KAF2803190.1 HET-domain-containing protein [Mytilinidion resinicola]
MEACANHSFYTVEVDESDQSPIEGIDDEKEVDVWLLELIKRKTSQASATAYTEQSERRGKVEELEEFVPSDTFYESDSIAKQIAKVKDRVVAEQALQWRKRWISSRTPQLLSRFFTPRGFTKLELPQWTQTPPSRERHSITCESNVQELERKRTVANIYKNLRLREPGNSIRLLALLPGEGPTLAATIYCEDLSSSPNYEALSYVWGEMKAGYIIEVEGTKIEITPNLYHAFQGLRLKQSPRVLWIDSLCINQNDNQEKASQIGMMLEIYRSAQTTVVYLGEPYVGASALFSFLNRDYHEEESFEQILQEVGFDERELLKAYVHFCFLPWWNRVWVQQEYTLSRTDPLFHLGRSSTRASALLRDIRLLQNKVALRLIPFASEFILESDVQESWQAVMRQILHVNSVLTLRLVQADVEFAFWIPRSILRKVNLRCTNPRDKIYGMRSFLDPVSQPGFAPKYSEPIEATFQKLALWVLVLNGWQQVFWWYPYKLSAKTPSWVPDFTKPVPESAMLEYSLLDFGKVKKSSSCPLAIRDGVSALEGYLLDSVKHEYAINQRDWPNTVRELWFLENIFAAIPTPEVLRNSPPVFTALPTLHTKQLIRKWSSPIPKRDMESICFELPPFNTFENDDIIDTVYDPLVNEIMDGYRTHIAAFENLGEQRRGQSPVSEIETNMQRLKHMNIARAYLDIYYRLSTLKRFLMKANTSCTDLFGAALFDHPNLLDQIQYLRKPSQPRQFSTSQLTVVCTRLRGLATPFNSGSSEEWIPNNESGIAAKVQPCYKLLQQQITACEHEEEVILRVRFVLNVVNATRSFPDSTRNKSSRTHDSYVHKRDKRATNWETFISTIVENRNRWLELQRGVVEEAQKAFEQLSNHVPAADEISAMISDFKAASEQSQITSDQLKATTEWAASSWEEAKPKLLENTMFLHNEKTFDRESYEHTTWLSGRTFFDTHHGLVGMGCQGITDIRVGDKVIVLKNTEFPMIIRETEDKQYHRIVGYALVRGFNYENFEKLERYQKPPREVFYFR